MASELVAYVDRLGYLHCEECAKLDERLLPTGAGPGEHCAACGWKLADLRRDRERSEPMPNPAAAPFADAHAETAYGVTVRLSHAVRVF